MPGLTLSAAIATQRDSESDSGVDCEYVECMGHDSSRQKSSSVHYGAYNDTFVCLFAVLRLRRFVFRRRLQVFLLIFVLAYIIHQSTFPALSHLHTRRRWYTEKCLDVMIAFFDS